MSYRGHSIKFYEDFSATVAKKSCFQQGEIPAFLERSMVRYDIPCPPVSHLQGHGPTLWLPRASPAVLPRTHTVHTVTHEEWTSDIVIPITWLYGCPFLFLFDGLHTGKTRLWCLNRLKTLGTILYIFLICFWLMWCQIVRCKDDMSYIMLVYCYLTCLSSTVPGLMLEHKFSHSSLCSTLTTLICACISVILSSYQN